MRTSRTVRNASPREHPADHASCAGEKRLDVAALPIARQTPHTAPPPREHREQQDFGLPVQVYGKGQKPTAAREPIHR